MTVDQHLQILAHFKVKDREMLNNILDGDPVSFANVRHPFERLVSGYLDKGEGRTFEGFVTQVVLAEANKSSDKTKFAEMNMHWRPYHTHCSFCNVTYKVGCQKTSLEKRLI